MLVLYNPRYKEDPIRSQLPEELSELHGELATIDKIMEDERFLEPFIKRFYKRIGRPSTPVDVYLRMMILKRRYKLGYEALEREVSDSFKWRRFCHLSVSERVPDSTTLDKLTQKYGEDAINQLNDLLVRKIKEEKIIRSRRVRGDTTVVEANIHYPTDASLLNDSVKVIARGVRRLKEMGVGVAEKFRDRSRSAKRKLLSVVKVAQKRNNQAKEEIKESVKQLKEKAERTVKEADCVVKRAKEEIRQGGQGISQKVKSHVKRLEEKIEIAKKITLQTEEVLSGNLHIKERIVSLHEWEARPIKRDKFGKETEFGYKLYLQDTPEKIITSHKLYQGNPADCALAAPGIQEHTQILGKPPDQAAFDRGFTGAEAEIQGLGVKQVSIPKRGKKSQKRKEFERQRWFRRLQRFRAGGEATISVLKRRFQIGRSLYHGFKGAKCWVGWGIFTYNLTMAARLIR